MDYNSNGNADSPMAGLSSKFLALFLVSLGVFLCLSSLPGQASSNLQVFSDPPSLRAGSQETAVIVARVQDDTGAPAKDGIAVAFSTTLGTITSVAETRGGVARAVLASGSISGTAIVSVMVGESRTDIEVEFLAGSGEARPAISLLKIEGPEIIYYREGRVAVANQGGRFECGDIAIEAACLQYDFSGARILAQGNVILSRGKEKLAADALVFQARRDQGTLLRYDQGEAAVYSFTTPGLKQNREEKADLEQFQPCFPQQERNLILAKKIYTRTDGKVLFRDATVQLDGVDIISLPQYVANLNGVDADFAQQVLSMNNTVGLMADFPYYYAASANRIGCLRLTHNLTPEGAMQKRGWGIGLEEQYLLGENGNGTLNLDDLTEETVGLRWNHTQRLSARSQLTGSLRYTKFDGSSPRVLDAGTSYSQSLSRLSLGLSLRASSYANSKVYTAGLSAVTPAKPIGHSRFSYSTTARFNYGYAEALTANYSETDGTVTLTRSDKMTQWFSEGLSLRLNCPEWKLGDKSSITSGLTLGSTWSGDASNQALGANVGFFHRLPQNGSLRLSYWASLGCRQGEIGNLSHRQILNLNATYRKPGRLESMAFASYDVESSRFTGSTSLRYFPNFQCTPNGDPQWAVSFTGLLNKWQDNSLHDVKIGLARVLGNWEVSVNYSPHGSEYNSGFLSGTTSLAGTSGYGFVQELGRTFWIEIGARSF